MEKTAPTMSEYQARDLLHVYGVPVPDEALAINADMVTAQARHLGHPVALKEQSPHIAHKTDAGAVQLG